MRSDRLYLDDIIGASKAIYRFADRLIDAQGLDEEIILSAIMQKLFEIGEAAARLSPATKQRFNDVNWQDVVRFRNYAIHAYFALDWQIVRSAAYDEVPVLALRVAEILAILDLEAAENP